MKFSYRLLCWVIVAVCCCVPYAAEAQEECGEVLSLEESFDDYTSGNNVLPDCWVAWCNFDNGNKPHIESQWSYSGNSMYFGCGSNNDAPHTSLTIGWLLPADKDMYLDFLFYGYYINSKIEIGVCDNKNENGNNFVPIDTLVASGYGWYRYNIEFKKEQCGGKYIAFRMVQGMQPYSGTFVAIDNVILDYCRVKSASYSEVSADGATFAIDLSVGDSATVEYGVHGFARGTGTTIKLGNGQHITGLKSNTQYDFYIGAECSPMGDADDKLLTFTTRSAVAMPYCLNVSQQGSPDNWYNGSGVAFGTSTYDVYMSRYTSTYGYVRYMVLPMVEGENVENVHLSFEAWTNYSNDDGNLLRIGVTNNPYKTGGVKYVKNVYVNDVKRRYDVSLHDTLRNYRYIVMYKNADREYYFNDIGLYCGAEPHYGLVDADVLKVLVDDDVFSPFYIELCEEGVTPGNGRLVYIESRETTISELGYDKTYSIYRKTADMVDDGCHPHIITTTHRSDVPYCNTNLQPRSGQLYEGWYTNSTKRVLMQSNEIRLTCNYNVDTDLYMALPVLNGSVQDMVLNIVVGGLGIMEVGVMTDRQNLATFVPVARLSAIQQDGYNVHSINFESYVGTGKFIALRYYDGRCRILQMSVTKQSEPLYYQIDGNRIAIESDVNMLLPYYIEYGRQGFVVGTGTRVKIEDRYQVIDNLDAGVLYDFYMCDENGMPLNCTPQSLFVSSIYISSGVSDSVVLCEDFSTSAFINRCHAYNPVSWSSARHEMIVSSNIAPNYFVFPYIDNESLRNMQLSFDMYGDSCLQVGVMTNWADPLTFVPLTLTSCYKDYKTRQVAVDFSQYDGSGCYIAFRAFNFSSTISNLLLLYGYRAPFIRLVDHNRIMVSQSLSPLKNATEEVLSKPYYVEYGPKGFMPGEGVLVRVDKAWQVIDSLADTTVYDFYYRPSLSASAICFPYQLKTMMSDTLHYCHSFSGMPKEWVVNTANAKSYYTYDAAQQALKLRDVGSNSFYIILPCLNVDSLRNLELYFDYYGGSRITVGVMDDPYDYSSFKSVATLASTGAMESVKAHVSFKTYKGIGRFVALKASGGSSVVQNGSSSYIYNSWISNVVVQDYKEPSVVRYNTVAVVQADMSRHNRYYVEYGMQGFVPGTGQVVPIDASPDTIKGLDKNIGYDFYFSALPDKSSCQSPITQPMFSLPYCENFDNVPVTSSLPVMWNAYSSVNSSVEMPSLAIDNGTRTGSNDKALYMQCSKGTEKMVVLPYLDSAQLSKASLTMTVYGSHTSQGLEIGTVVSPSDTASFEPIFTFFLSSTYSSKIFTLNIDGRNNGRCYLAIRLKGQYSYYAYIDDLYLDFAPFPAIMAVNHQCVAFQQTEVAAPANYWVEFCGKAEAQGEGSYYHITSFADTLCGFEPNGIYTYFVHPDTLTPSCRNGAQIVMPGAIALPYCVAWDTLSLNSIPKGWWRKSTSSNLSGYASPSVVDVNGSQLMQFYHGSSNYQTLRLPVIFDEHDFSALPLHDIAVSFAMRSTNAVGSYLELGVMHDDESDYHLLKRFYNDASNCWQQMSYVINEEYDSTYRLVLRSYSSAVGESIEIDRFAIDTCGVCDVAMTYVGDGETSILWHTLGHPNVSVQYSDIRGFHSYYTTDTFMSISGLIPLSAYQFNVEVACHTWDSVPVCDNLYSDTLYIHVPAVSSSCVDPTNLYESSVACTFGTYSNPYLVSGVVDYGSDSPLSHHTVHTDTAERDPRTGGLLRTIPLGESASVRLGNWGTCLNSPEAESITYPLFVDTESFDFIVLRYAAVLQNPAHLDIRQPRFRIQLLDENNRIIDPDCSAADFVSNASLGWNEADNHVLWKDWTTVGIDLSAYANTTVRIRLTTYDCDEGSHYGYAYFTLSCGVKRFESEQCGSVESITFTAPAGFNYKWSKSNSSETFSNDRSITVLSDNSVTYLCEVSFIENPECSFTISAFAGERYPVASFSYRDTIFDCAHHVKLSNSSFVSTDGVTPLPTHERCETSHWDFGNGATSDELSPTAVYTSPGRYVITLVAGIGADHCTDTLRDTIDITFDAARPSISSSSTDICIGDSLWMQLSDAMSARWDTSSVLLSTSTDMYYFAPSRSVVVKCTPVNNDGCIMEPIFIPVVVHQPYSSLVVDTICSYDSLFFDGAYRHDADTYVNKSTDVNGCDSVISLELHVADYPMAQLADTIVERMLPWTRYGVTHLANTDTLLRVPPLDKMSLNKAMRCDTVMSYSLVILTNDTVRLDTSLCNQTIEWNNLKVDSIPSLSADTLISCTRFVSMLPLNAIHSVPGIVADTVYILSVTEHPNYSTVISDAYCSNEGYFYRGEVYTTDFDSLFHLSSQYGCDSMVHVILNAKFSVQSFAYDTCIESMLPRSFNGKYFTHAINDTAFHYDIGSECDSLVRYSLHVWYNIFDTIDTVLCDHFDPLEWHGYIFYNNPSYASQHLPVIDSHNNIFSASHGEDSMIVYFVYFYRSSSSELQQILVQNELPAHVGDTALYTSVQDTLFRLTNVYGCDSLLSYSLVVYNNEYTSLDTSLCYSALPYTWHNILLSSSGVSNHIFDTLRVRKLYSNVYGADSLVSLVVVVKPEDSTVQKYVVCDSLRWIDNNVYRSSISDSSVFSVLTNRYGCDSVVYLSLTVNSTVYTEYLDSFCYGDTYLFEGRSFSSSVDSVLVRSAANGCDSMVSLQLHRLKALTPTINVEPHCRENTYTLTASGCGEWIGWASPDVYLDTLSLSLPAITTGNVGEGSVVSLLTQYTGVLSCMEHAEIYLPQLHAPTARFVYSPRYLTRQYLSFAALSQCEGDKDHYWMVDGYASGSGDTLHYTVNHDHDSVLVQLVAAYDRCFDTASHVIPIYSHDFFAPNVFTPGRIDNNRFRVYVEGVEHYSLYVYNRQGLLVFHTDDPSAEWDGALPSGEPCPQGAYIWVVRYSVEVPNAECITHRGMVTLLR